ncbi:hypothetical protein QNI19_04360 [Cytophagaceae bacterium DM2B3-1]|uniref:IPExxxVDY family protein n=1 Tax=Xanthocytophaga flava TaxID=3048013 RepID=A0ABT7CEM2_9BACT|nr:hypothetical protein [Xanthocytophaga flavus]MDJ1468973.1 hypothetical protein [Xanthocytophaga flavus]MDJ1492151.1 hypothetical protein [Xanthocytophaga flavus]
MNVLDFITEDIEIYLDKALNGFTKPVQVSILDLNRSETEIATILSIDKNLVKDQKEALIILINRFLYLREEWLDFSIYTKEDILRSTDWWLRPRYSDSTFHPDTPFTEQFDILSDYLRPSQYVVITHENKVVTREEFRALSPLSTENILHIASSQLDWSQFEIYIETDTQFMFFHWYTSA